MRHTFCSCLVQLGAPLANVKELMGHEVIQTTMRYAHLYPDQDASDISLLSRFVTNCGFCDIILVYADIYDIL